MSTRRRITSTRSNASAVVKPARLGAFTFGIQIVWGAVLAVSLQARSTELAGDGAIALFATIAPIGAALATVVQVVIGFAADARRAAVGHRREFLAGGVLLAIPALIGFYVAPTLAGFVASFFTLQVALNIATGPYQAAIPDYVPPERRGEASSWMSAWQSLGNAVGLLVAGFVRDLRTVAALLVGALVAAFAVTYAHMRALPALETNRVGFRVDRVFLTLLVSRGIVNLGFFTLLGFLFFFVQQSLGVGGTDAVQTQTALLFLTFTLTAIAGAALASRPSDRYDVRLVATVANAAVVVALAVLANSTQLGVAYGAAALAGCGWGAFFTADWALACALLPRGAMATAMGVWNVATAGPQILAPILGGSVVLHFNAIAPGVGPRAAVVFALTQFVLGTILLWLLPATRSARAVAPA
jgi:MFS family permease